MGAEWPSSGGGGGGGLTEAEIKTLIGTLSQPLDSDLTAVAALSTTSYGRAFLVLATAAAARTAIESPSNAELAALKGEVAPLDTDGTLAANSDTRVAPQKATKTYVDAEKTARESAVSTEKTRAETAEALKASKTELGTETTGRESADTTEKNRAETAEALKLAKASNLSDLASSATALANLGAYSAFAPQLPLAMFPVGGVPGEVVSAFIPGEKIPILVRVIAPKAGTLKDLMVFPRTSAGNVAMGIYDTGDAEAGKRTRLFQSGSFAVGTANKWQVVAAEPNITVKAGQQLDLYVVFDSATVECGRSLVAVNGASYQLPTNYNKVTGGASAKLVGTTTAITAISELPATITEASITAQGSVAAVACRVE